MIMMYHSTSPVVVNVLECIAEYFSTTFSDENNIYHDSINKLAKTVATIAAKYGDVVVQSVYGLDISIWAATNGIVSEIPTRSTTPMTINGRTFNVRQEIINIFGEPSMFARSWADARTTNGCDIPREELLEVFKVFYKNVDSATPFDLELFNSYYDFIDDNFFNRLSDLSIEIGQRPILKRTDGHYSCRDVFGSIKDDDADEFETWKEMFRCINWSLRYDVGSIRPEYVEETIVRAPNFRVNRNAQRDTQCVVDLLDDWRNMVLERIEQKYPKPNTDLLCEKFLVSCCVDNQELVLLQQSIKWIIAQPLWSLIDYRNKLRWIQNQLYEFQERIIAQSNTPHHSLVAFFELKKELDGYSKRHMSSANYSK